MIQHKNIPDAQLHEPKGVATASVKRIYFADGAGSGEWRKISDKEIDYSSKTNNLFGWNDIADSLYTSASPRSIAATTRTLLTNNAAAAQTDTSRLGTIWDTTNNQFLINDLNASYILRIRANVKASAAGGVPYAFKLEIESANGPTIVSATDQIIKGGSYENSVAFTTLFYNGSFINNQALKLYVTADTAITLYNVGYVIQRIYKES